MVVLISEVPGEITILHVTLISINCYTLIHSFTLSDLPPSAWKQVMSITISGLKSFLTNNPNMDVNATNTRKQAPIPIRRVTACQ